MPALPPDVLFLKHFPFCGESARELENLRKRWVALAGKHLQAAWGIPGGMTADAWTEYRGLAKCFLDFADRNGCIEKEYEIWMTKLQLPARVHEAYLRLVGDQRFDRWGHFVAAGTEAMRKHPSQPSPRSESA